MLQRFALVGVMATAVISSAAAQVRRSDDTWPLIETERIHHVVSRFAFGPTPGLVEAILQQGLTPWFESQLEGSAPASPALEERLAVLDSLQLTNQQILCQYRDREGADKDRRLRIVPRTHVQASVLFRAIYSPQQLTETACDFFRNHFNVDVGKDSVRYFVTEYEREVLRKNVLGNFGTMLMASAKHPAMLVYLDNYLSRRPPSKQELREIERSKRKKTGSKERAKESVEIAKQRGLNENYARELLELHTLGVDNFYGQHDIVELAKALTGWTVQANPEYPVTFRFRADMHVEGDKRFLGAKVQKDRDNPVSEGERIITGLSKHSGTARFLAWKLCRFYVADDPPEAMVNRVADVFKKAKGDLPSVYRAIFDDPEFFNPEFFQSKLKRPFEFVVSSLRVTGAEVDSTGALRGALITLSEPIYECEDPTGYYDQAEAWGDPGVMALRWRFAMDFVNGRLRGVRVPDRFYEDLHPSLPLVWKDQLARKVLATRMTSRTNAAIESLIRNYLESNPKPKKQKLAPQILGVLLGSPEFQRQ